MNKDTSVARGLTGDRGTRGGCGGRSSIFTLPPDIERYDPVQVLQTRSDHRELQVWIPACPKPIEPILISRQTETFIERHLAEPNLRVRLILGSPPPVDLHNQAKKNLHFSLRQSNLDFTDNPLSIRFDRTSPNSRQRNSTATFTDEEVGVLSQLKQEHLWYVCLMKSAFPESRLEGVSGPDGVIFQPVAKNTLDTRGV